MILGDVEETVTTIVIDDETYEEIYKVSLGLSSDSNQLTSNLFLDQNVYNRYFENSC